MGVSVIFQTHPRCVSISSKGKKIHGCVSLFSFFLLLQGCQTVLSPTASEPDTTLAKASPKNSIKGDKDPGEESEAVDGKLSIFIHKREDQSSHEVLQPLLR